MTLITNIKDVLPAIEGRKDFIVIEKEGYTVVDYVHIGGDDTFDDPIRLECRGLKFDSRTGDIIARTLHKFMNVGEKVASEDIDWSKPHIIMDKLDGSMVHGVLLNGEVRLMTRMGLTDHALRAEKLLTDELKEKIKYNIGFGHTPIFEWTGPDNRIVLEYDKNELSLLADRNIATGEYTRRGVLKLIAEHWELPLVKIVDIKRELMKEQLGIEGYVIWFTDDDYFVKVKTDEYLMMHRAVSFFDREDKVLACVLAGKCDDLYPALSVENANRLRDYEIAVNLECVNLAGLIDYDVDMRRDESRKNFAYWVNNNVDKPLRGCYFNVLDGRDALESVKKVAANVLEVRW